MGEEDSWQKIDSLRRTSEWLMSIKSEKMEGDNVNSSDYKFEGTHFMHVKPENEDQHSNEIINSNMDPLNIFDESAEPARRRRSKGSGPKNETPEERAARLSKMSAYAAKRLAGETPEQRAVRLKRMSEYAARRLRQETSEQRAKRLQRMSAYAAKRLSEETAEQRRMRLERMSAYAAKRQAMKKMSKQSSSQSIELENNIEYQS